jgi:signal transduction histidine kinase
MLLNMAMASAVVIAAFAVIFIITYAREQESNREKLSHGATPVMTVAGTPFHQESGAFFIAEPGANGSTVAAFPRRIQPGAGLSFSLLVDAEGNVIGVNSMVDIMENAYMQAAVDVAKSSANDATVNMDGRVWRYSVSPVTIEFNESSDVTYFVSGAYSDIRFLDVTDSNSMLLSLGLTLSGLTIVILAVFFFISRFFANRAIRPMEEAFDKQNRFIADASHELKTPLSVISANCGALYATSDETIDSQVKWVDSIMRAADRMTGLIGDLLSLSRMEDKEHELRITSFDLSAAAADAVSDIEHAALEKELTIESLIEPEIMIESDRDQILKILSILMDNAAKYTDSGGNISVSVKKENRRAVCYVRNSGCGIPAEDLQRVFDRFYRSDPARSSENGGYGLGLAIAKAIADRLGAKLLAGSEPGEYTEFRLMFDLP